MFRKNKKAQIGSGISLIVSLIITLIIIVAGFVVIKAIHPKFSEDLKISSSKNLRENIEVNSIYSFLQTPISENKNVFNLFILGEKEKIKKEALDVFSIYDGFSLITKFPKEEMIISKKIKEKKHKTQEVLIPSYQGLIKIKLILKNFREK